MSDRIQKLQSLLTSEKIDGIVVSSPVNIFYLTGYGDPVAHEREGFVFITKNKSYFITVRMFEEAVKKNAKVDEIVILKQNEGFAAKLGELVGKDEKIGFEDNDLKVAEFEKFKSNAKCNFVPIANLIAKIRMIKDKDEIELIRKATALTRESIDFIWREFCENPEQNEIDLVNLFQEFVNKHYAKFAFDPIVAGGAGSSEPHYKSQTKKIDLNQPLLIDAGIKLRNYNGDITRTFLPKKSEKFTKEIYEIVDECKKYCISLCAPGKKFADIHKAAVEFFAKYKYEKYFIHSIGHGLGIKVHEMPFASQDVVLEERMVVTIEPGLYFQKPYKFGIRLEDVVLITKEGCEVL